MAPDRTRSLPALLTGFLNRVEDLALMLSFGAMLALSVAQIVLRNTVGGGPAWTEELLRILVLFLALIGSTAASRTANHIQIDLLTRYMPERLRHAARALTMLFTTLACGTLAWFAWRFVAGEREAGSVVLGNLPAWTVQLVLPLGFALIALRYFFHFLHAVTGTTSGGGDPA